MRLQLTPRLGYLAGFVVCGGLLAYALYLQYYQYQNPCPLCILQRVAYIVRSLKHPMETELLRHVYGSSFVLVAAYAPRGSRLQRKALIRVQPRDD